MTDTKLELFSLLDNIDTLGDICKDDDKLFRKLALREASKRFDFAKTDGHKVEFKDEMPVTTGIDAIDNPAAGCTYKPDFAYTFTNKAGELIVVRCL